MDKNPFTLSRSDAYLGVLIDDLVTKGTPEPYRMFTSRAEHRLVLRHDNADLRLTPLAREAGVIDDHRWQCFEQKALSLERLRLFCATTTFDGMRINIWLKRPENNPSRLPAIIRAGFDDELWESVETELKYAGYIARQEIEIEKLRLREDNPIPTDIDFDTVPSLRPESRQKLTKVRPETFGQASRISGVTPADVAILSIFLRNPTRRM